MENKELRTLRNEMKEMKNRKHRNNSVRVDLKSLQNDFSLKKQTSIENCVNFMRSRFAGIDIDKNDIVKACNRVFDRCSTQEQLNRECTQYLLKNLANM